jgi:hypothetical protein
MRSELDKLITSVSELERSPFHFIFINIKEYNTSTNSDNNLEFFNYHKQTT